MGGANEASLRQWNWIEENRQYVDEQTDGKVGYIYLPDTAAGGFTYFNRMFFAQVDKQAMIIDERSLQSARVRHRRGRWGQVFHFGASPTIQT